MSLNRTGQETNEELITPGKEHWDVQRRNQFKLLVTVQKHGMTELEIMKFQKRVELLTAEVFESGTFRFEIQ